MAPITITILLPERILAGESMFVFSSAFETVFSRSSSMTDVDPVVDSVASTLVSLGLIVTSALDSVASVLDSVAVVSGGLSVVFVTVASNVDYIYIKKISMRSVKMKHGI